MPVITFITDFGIRDFEAAMLKGLMLQTIPGVQFVDITHGVTPFQSIEAAFMLRNAFPYFPKGTIHFIGVNIFGSLTSKLVVLQHQEQFFIGVDDGLFSLAFGTLPTAYEICTPVLKANFRQQIVEAAASIATKGNIDTNRYKEVKLVEKRLPSPMLRDDQLFGQVIYLDGFRNAVTNISRQIFDQAVKGRPFRLFYKGLFDITSISEHYYDGPIGTPLCLFNSHGLLEIAARNYQVGDVYAFKNDENILIQIE